MPKKLSEIQKKEIIDSFVNGDSIDELSKKFKCTKTTITRHLKKGVSEKKFKILLKQNNKKDLISDLTRNLKSNQTINDRNVEENRESMETFVESSFVEITPLNCQIDNTPQKDLSSIPISEIDLPKIVYMVINNKIELETKTLREYPDWQFLSQNELNRETIEIFFDMKIAKRYCTKEQKVIKVPNTNVFKIVAPILVSKGISRIVSPEKLIAL